MGLVSEARLKSALAIQGTSKKKLGKIFIEQDWITEDELIRALSKKLDVETVEIDSYVIDPRVVKAIPMDLAVRYKVIPLFIVENTLTLAMADPLDIRALDAVRYYTGKQVIEVLAIESDIEAAIQKYYSVEDSMNSVISDINEQVTLESDATEAGSSLGNSDSDEASIIRFVNLLLQQAVTEKASDIHLEPDEDIFRIRFRVDGILHEVSKTPINLSSMIVSRLKVLSDLDVSEKRLPQDGRFRSKFGNKDIDFRVSILPTVYGEKVVTRLLDPQNALLELKDLGFSESVLRQWRSVITKSEGMCLITGPTGSGKTTSLYAVLNAINSIEKNIVTVENPVEYNFPLINQVQVNSDIGMTFASVLRSILRQDPDIIMIGEIRDGETAEIATRSALTGHLVFSTLHTNDAPSSIFRLIDMGIDPFLVNSSVNAILAQRLVRTICSHCKEVDKAGIIALQKTLGVRLKDDQKILKGKGCRACKNTGYSGRAGIYELLTMDENIRRIVLSNGSTDDIRAYTAKNRAASLRQDGLLKVLKGITTVEEVFRVSSV